MYVTCEDRRLNCTVQSFISSRLVMFSILSYSTIAFAASLIKGKVHGVNYGLRSSTSPGIAFDIFNAMGTIGFAFAGHSVCLEIQATIPSTPEKPSTKPMWQGVVVAYLIVALCYFCVAIVGFWAFGNTVEDDVLMSLDKPSWLIALANFMVFLHVLGSYQVSSRSSVSDPILVISFVQMLISSCCFGFV